MRQIMSCLAAVVLALGADRQQRPAAGSEAAAVGAPRAADPLLPPPTSPTIDPKVTGLSPIGPVAGAAKVSPPAPRPLPPDLPGKPIPAEHKAPLTDQPSEPRQSPATPSQPTDQQSPPAEPARPWLLLTLVTFSLFASLGGNVYLAWITWGVYRRYRALLASGRNEGLGIRD